MNVRRVLLDVDKAIQRPEIVDTARTAGSVQGVQGVNIDVTEIDVQRVEEPSAVVYRTCSGRADPDLGRCRAEHRIRGTTPVVMVGRSWLPWMLRRRHGAVPALAGWGGELVAGAVGRQTCDICVLWDRGDLEGSGFPTERRCLTKRPESSHGLIGDLFAG